MNRIIRRISTALLLLIVLLHITTIILMEIDAFDVSEFHEILGFTLLGLIAVHIIIFRKSLKAFLFKA